ncbi:MAG: dihydropteroate synthase [Fuerstiella sp.]|nr:dihydropteroate synthase [Fuerstiella sp.]MCP4859421.1 dihydropteroate synthase [Fuerstiella sp.]
MENSTVLFVTGRLAEFGLRETVAELSQRLGFQYEILVPGIQVAALLHVNLLQKRLQVPTGVDRVVLPGWCQGNLAQLETHFGMTFERGPRDYRDLPEHFGLGARKEVRLDDYSVDIIAEINHATRMSVADVVAEAKALSDDGADLIDVGCVPGESCRSVGEIVLALRDENLRVSIDSFDRHEVELAVAAGAELILSCNHTNIEWVTEFGVEVVAIPDTPSDTESLDRLIAQLSSASVPYRIDPIIEPIGMGFTASLRRYMDARQKYPDVPMMMGIGNVTELTEVDSAGVNILLAAVCEELGIRSVLTTQVINWCRTAVAEFSAARRLVAYSIHNHVIPKHLDSSLVMLRDAKLRRESEDSLNALAAALTDPNFRIYATSSTLHLMNNTGHWHGDGPFEVFSSALKANRDVDAGHAFYLGYELARAEVARFLGKQYTQDEPLQWGVLGEIPGSSAVRHGSTDEDNDGA